MNDVLSSAECATDAIQVCEDNKQEVVLPSNIKDLARNLGLTVVPGFCDVHVHFREPGFSYKETIKTGSLAAAHGGYTAVCTMPNLNPAPDSLEHLAQQEEIIARDACVHVLPLGTITKEERGQELADLRDLAPRVIGFSDDGRGVQDTGLMREAMLIAKSLDKPIIAHCEDNSLLNGGYIHEGVYAKEHGHRGICSASEYKQVERDIALAQETGCAYHVCHVSAKESVALIRAAKKDGIDVSCETTPHYLTLDENDLEESGSFKMNPPLREEDDRLALIEGVLDGTIDMIATDHAPHSAEEKWRGLEGSCMGIVGLECAFPVLYTYLVRSEVMTLEKLLDLLVYKPRARFRIPLGENDYSIWALHEHENLDPATFLSKGKSTPFAGLDLFGVNKLTVCDNHIVYEAPQFLTEATK